METRTCKEYREMAWGTLQPYWNEVAVITLLIMLCACLGSGIGLFRLPKLGTGVSFVVSILLVVPLSFSFARLILGYIRKEERASSAIQSLLDGCMNHYTKYVLTGLLMYVLIAIVSICTLCIGGIILSLAYAMVPFLLKDQPELGVKETLRKSRMMMRGHKWDLCLLCLSFIGWWLLCVISFGIALLWVSPYINTTIGYFYDDIRNEQQNEN